MQTIDFQDLQAAFYIAFFWPIVFLAAVYFAVSLLEVLYVVFGSVGKWLKYRGR